MNTKTQVIEGLTRAATATRRLRPVVESNCGEDDDASYLEVALESIDAALALLRSLPSEQGEGPYKKVECGSNRPGSVKFYRIKGPDDEMDYALHGNDVDYHLKRLNAAYQAGRLSAGLQQGEPIAYTTRLALEVSRNLAGTVHGTIDANVRNIWGDQGVALYTHPLQVGEEGEGDRLEAQQERQRLDILNKALGMIAPAGYWFREMLEKIWHAKTQQEAEAIAIDARRFIDATVHGTGPRAEQQELIRAGDAMRVCELLASAWHYGKMKFETPCEEEMKVLLESLGLWPTTEDEIVARSQRAAKQSSPSQPASTEPRLTVERAMDAVDAEPELPDDMPDEMWEACRSDRATMQEALRVAVRLTKEGINDRISKTATGN